MNSPKPRLKNSTNLKDLYKSPANHRCATPEIDSNNNPSPAWRSLYKKRCFDEFKKSRAKLVNRFRDLNVNANQNESKGKIKDYLEEELQKICLLEATTKPELKISVDEAAEIMRQIQLELIPAQISDEELIEILRLEEQNDMMNQEAILNNSSIYVVCPLCQKSSLEQSTPSLITCKNTAACNFKIDQTQVKCDLNELSVRLQKALASHNCSQVPYFQSRSDIVPGSQDANMLMGLTGSFRSSFLLMSCDTCNLMEFIF